MYRIIAMLKKITNIFKIPSHIKWFKEGYQKMMNGEYKSAVDAFDKSLAIEPIYEAYINRAAALFYLNNHQAAIKDYRTAIQLEPTTLEAYLGLGIVQTKTKHYQEAVKTYNQVIIFNPYHSPALTNRGFIYLQTQRLDLALKDFNRAIDLDPNNALALSNRGTVYRELGLLSKAEKDWQKASGLGFKEAHEFLLKYC